MESAEVTKIDVAYPDTSNLHLQIGVGACRLNVTPGDGPAWVAGTYDDPSHALPHKIEQEGGTVKITQAYKMAEWWNLFGGAIPKIDLALGKARPYVLTLEVGASENQFDLGGLPISRLLIRQGAGKAGFDFSTPNPEAMSLLDLEAGAVGIEMQNLANANFAEMTVHGGAASYKFDFGGALRRDAHVRITTGMSSVDIAVPASTAVKITTETVLGGTDVGDGFMKKEGAFWTEAALAGKTPVLTIHASMTMGGLRIRAIG
jgi:hypothetical protein